jgi:acyl-coenzyme A thioesterase PaaI-like protein
MEQLMKAARLRWLMNCWPPFLAAGIRVRNIAPDYRQVRVELRMRWSNRNYVGVHFGGSLFAMTDPFFMLMYMNNLGADYIVWDRAGRIEFIRPGRGTVSAEFRLTAEDLESARAKAASGRPALIKHEVDVVDQAGELVARVERTVYVRLKPRLRDAAQFG